MKILVHLLINALSVYLVAQWLPGFHVASFESAIVVSIVLGLLTVFLGPLLTFLGTVLALPAVVLTLGLFYFVIRCVVGLFLLWLTTRLVGGFSIDSSGTLILAAVLMSVVQHVAALVLQPLTAE